MAHRAILIGLKPVCTCNQVIRLQDHLGGTARSLWRRPGSFESRKARTKRLTRHLSVQPMQAAQTGTSEQQDYEAFDQHQSSAARVEIAEEARTLLEVARIGTLSTVASDGAASGFPSGSVVEYAPDDKGRPIFMLSSISPHTKHLRKDSRCSLTVLGPAFRDLADARVSLTGHARAMPQDREDAVKLMYKSKNPESFWADFGDFKPFYMEEVVAVHFNGGFGRAGRKVTPEEIMSTPADPLVPFASHVVQHMNEDHADSLVAMVKHFTGLTVDKAHLVALDRLGMDCVCIKDKGRMKCRLPYTRSVTTRSELRAVIVEMSKAAQVGVKQWIDG
ncbi:hypothetical protein ABBQ38_009464 [Trebouxia sp. C0009 RCD-2024]